ncbi:energy transducer TonB [Pontixanthobacter aestiaquae]|uniref:TonB C-terminal domain-containing protein n=1 Tax=Pontixanthobacter aestiaquae TaxID=1509367 RepID=A0A844Z980_9SPHN|nr:energy transducer TonB [Pontixanthobacter aestiaquae]MDN3646566.1 energy transducer TonB [Pontixanthobacter aestiaquae]MXO82449.1 hypothetical protein [Pontixanthobacter aestiaquae]
MKLALSSLFVAAVAPTPFAYAQAQETDGDIEAWSVTEGDLGCKATRTITSAVPIEVQTSRSYHDDVVGGIWLRIDWPVAEKVEYSNNVAIRFAGETAAIGTGFVFPSGDDSTPKAGITILMNALGEERLSSGSLPDDAAFTILRDGQELRILPVGGLTYETAELDECIARVGKRLLDARPDPYAGPPSDPSPRNYRGMWVTNDDYRVRWINEGMQGTVSFMLSINRYGLAEKCEVTSSSGYQEIDRKTCQLVRRRARMYPARDEEGNAVAGLYSSTVRWQIPE